MSKVKSNKFVPKRKQGAQVTRVALVVDRSGSMQSIVKQARDGLVEQLATIEANADKCDETYVSLISFDYEIKVHLDNVDVDKLPIVDPNEVIQPRGSTAMNDAVMKAIDLLSKQEQTDTTGNLIIVISDGEENSSETKSSTLSGRIKELENTGNWTFTFMLSNVDVHVVADKLGVSRNNMAYFTSNAAGTKSAYDTLTLSTTSYFNMRSAGMTQTSNFYDNNDPQTPIKKDDVK